MTSTSAELVREIRGDLAQDELAARAGFARASISRWEGGLREPGLAELRRLATCVGKSLDVAIVSEVDPEHLDLVEGQLDIGPTQRVRALAGDGWPAIRAGLRAAAVVANSAAITGPAGAALRGAPQRVEGASVDLLVAETDAVAVVERLIDDARAHSLGVFTSGAQRRQLFRVDADGLVSLTSETHCGLQAAQVVQRADLMALNEEGIDVVRVASAEDLLELAESASWFGSGAIRGGLRAVLAARRYSARSPEPAVTG